MKHFEEKLPENYRLVKTVDATKAPFAVVFNLLSLVMMVGAFAVLYFAFGTENAGLNVTNLKITINDDAAVQSIFNQNSPTPSSSINDIVRDKSQGVNDGSVDIIYQNT